MQRRTVITGMMALAASPVFGEAKSRKKGRGKGSKKGRRDEERIKPRGTVADSVLAPLAKMIGQGFTHEGLTPDELEYRIAQGERVIVLCGLQSILGVRALQRAGIEARMVNPMTREAWDGGSDAHVQLEARLDGRWQVYDMTYNAQAVDSKGHGIDISTLCLRREHRWRKFAKDPVWEDGTSHSVRDVRRWYMRILQIPIIEYGGFWCFNDDTNRDRIEALHHSYHYVDAATWAQIVS